MTRIGTTHYRYKRPPRRKQPVALEAPAVVKATDPAKAHRLPVPAPALPGVVSTSIKRAALPEANDDHKSAIVTARRPKAIRLLPGLLPETPEEHRQRGDAADALWRDMKRRISEKLRKP